MVKYGEDMWYLGGQNMSELTIASEVSGVVADCVKAGGRGCEVTQDFRLESRTSKSQKIQIQDMSCCLFVVCFFSFP